MKQVIVIVAALMLAACAGSQPPPVPVVIYKQANPAKAPVECDERGDPKWRDLPKGDAKRSTTIDKIAENKRHVYRPIANRRAVCGAALREHGMIK